MKIDFLAPATAEFKDAIAHYNLQSEGLGFEFAAEVKRTLERIVQYPEAWSPLSNRTRRCRTNRFPYGVIYQIREEDILVVAIMHLSRAPQTWKSRLKKKDGRK
jgi:plasmid stabilization system protein ParE